MSNKTDLELKRLVQEVRDSAHCDDSVMDLCEYLDKQGPTQPQAVTDHTVSGVEGCEWIQEEEVGLTRTYYTDCGSSIMTGDDRSLKEQGIHYCHNCGKSIYPHQAQTGNKDEQ